MLNRHAYLSYNVKFSMHSLEIEIGTIIKYILKYELPSYMIEVFYIELRKHQACMIKEK